MPTLNYTTTIPAVRTIGEIQAMLADHGAEQIVLNYVDKKPAGLAFSLPTAAGVQLFNLPVDVPAVKTLLAAQRRRNSRVDDRLEQAERVAWRVIKDWLAAQIAIIEAGMASLDQVMLPYLMLDADRTVYQTFVEHGLKQVTA